MCYWFSPLQYLAVKKTDKSLTWNLPTTKHGEIGNAKMKVSGAPRGLFFQASRDAGERMNRCSFVLALIGAVVLASPALGTGFQSDEVEMSHISGTVEKPRRHFRLKNAQTLSSEEAVQIYQVVRQSLAAGYSLSKASTAKQYQSWQRFNSQPYLPRHTATTT